MLEAALGILIGLSAGIHVGLYLHRLTDLSEKIWNRDPEPEPKVVTPLRPGYSDVNEQSFIVSPKTPQQIEREEQERVRNL